MSLQDFKQGAGLALLILGCVLSGMVAQKYYGPTALDKLSALPWLANDWQCKKEMRR